MKQQPYNATVSHKEASVRRSKPNVIECATDSQLLGLTLSPAQETFLRTLNGLPLINPEQHDIWQLCTQREPYKPGHVYPEGVVCAGARSGKDSRIIAVDAVHGAAFGGHEKYLSRGERGIIANVAQDQRATGVSAGYIRSYFTESPLLKSMVEEATATEIRLTNRLAVFSFPNTKESIRGWSIPRAYLNEVAFWRQEGSPNADAEIQASIRRGMIAFPQTRLIKASTPYMKSGVLYSDFKEFFGVNSPDVLVWRAPSTLMNPTIREGRLQREQRLDPLRFAREYLAEFAEDLDSFLPTIWIEDAVAKGCHERPPLSDVSYTCAVDTSGGSESKTGDKFTFSIVHLEEGGENQRVIQDVMKGWKTRDLESVVSEIARICKAYHTSEVWGDLYAAGWVIQRFGEHQITYRESTKRESDGDNKRLDKSRIYLECEPLFAQGRISILDHPELQRELRLLERRLRPGGKTIVDHPTGSHDDFANSLCLAAVKASEGGTFHPEDLYGGGERETYSYDSPWAGKHNFTPDW